MADSGTMSSSNRWLYGPVPDLLLGCGVGYMVVFTALVLAGPEIRSFLPLGMLALVSVFFGTPHYGATLLRVYEQRSERRRYVVFTIYLSIVVWAFFVAGLYSVLLGSLLLSLYLTWSPWHYTGQNYGVTLLFLRRRGIAVTPDVKRWIYASFVLSYFLTFLAIHGMAYTGDYAPVDYSGSIYRNLRLGIPAPGWAYAFGVLFAAYVVTIGVSARKLLARAERAVDLVPSALVAATQLLWFSLPPLGRELGLLRGLDPFQPSYASFVFIWVAAGHAAQYLWVSSFYAGKRTRGARWGYYTKCVFAGSAIWSLPALAYLWSGLAGSRFGGIASGDDAGVLLAAVVNIHHFMLDGAIWKLRDGRVARALIRSREEIGPEPIEPGFAFRRRWLSPILLGAGALWTFSTIASLVDRERVFTPALERGDLAAAEASLGRLAWMRRDGLTDYYRLAEAALKSGDDVRSLGWLDRAIERHGQPASFLMKGRLLERQGDVEEAAAAFEAGLLAAPDDAGLLYALGRLRLEQGRVGDARALLERAQRAAPDDGRVRLTLDRALRGDLEGAAGAASAALPTDG